MTTTIESCQASVHHSRRMACLRSGSIVSGTALISCLPAIVFLTNISHRFSPERTAARSTGSCLAGGHCALGDSVKATRPSKERPSRTRPRPDPVRLPPAGTSAPRRCRFHLASAPAAWPSPGPGTARPLRPAPSATMPAWSTPLCRDLVHRSGDVLWIIVATGEGERGERSQGDQQGEARGLDAPSDRRSPLSCTGTPLFCTQTGKLRREFPWSYWPPPGASQRTTEPRCCGSGPNRYRSGCPLSARHCRSARAARRPFKARCLIRHRARPGRPANPVRRVRPCARAATGRRIWQMPHDGGRRCGGGDGGETRYPLSARQAPRRWVF